MATLKGLFLSALLSGLRYVQTNEPIVSDYPTALRRQIHFLPPMDFSNNPNGHLVDVNGTLHLYYQCGAEATLRARTSITGRTTSSPCIRRITPAKVLAGGVVTIYILNTLDNQVQEIPYSRDSGYTFTPYEGKPVIDINSTQFRDPQGHSNECPNLVKIPAKGSDKEMHLLTISLSRGAPLGGSVAKYFPGTFNGHAVHPQGRRGTFGGLWEGQLRRAVLYGVPEDEQPVSIAWASNWQYTVHVTMGKERWHRTSAGDLVQVPVDLFSVLAANLGSNDALVDARPTADFADMKSNAHCMFDFNCTHFLGEDTAFAAKDYNRAIELFSQGIALDPSNHVLGSNRSAAYDGKKDLRQA
ncbi:glycosyl hydrolase [Schizophyllum commune]